jgi:hypothetical protein
MEENNEDIETIKGNNHQHWSFACCIGYVYGSGPVLLDRWFKTIKG